MVGGGVADGAHAGGVGAGSGGGGTVGDRGTGEGSRELGYRNAGAVGAYCCLKALNISVSVLTCSMSSAISSW